jgi:hypothetical protein
MELPDRLRSNDGNARNDRASADAAVWLAALLALGCGRAEVSPISGGAPGSSAPGSEPGGPAAPPPVFTLPDAGPLPVAPDAGGPARQCAEQAHQAEVVPLDLLLLVDASGSMDQLAGVNTKWETAQTALTAFVRDPRSAGLGVGIQFFPSNIEKPCTRDADCFPGIPGTAAGLCRMLPAGRCSADGTSCTNAGQPCPGGSGTCQPPARSCRLLFPTLECDQVVHERPAVAISDLPAAEARVVGALNANEPIGGTPMGPAVRGALAHIRARLQANPGRRAALIMASDGLPDPQCPMSDIPAIAATLAEAYGGTPSIPTYVIGVFGEMELAMAQMAMNQLAMAGGSNQAFVLEANADLTRRLQEALNQIRGAALACEYRIPPPSGGPIDFQKVNVRYTGAAGAENIPYVERADRCDPMRGGWYYDVPPAMGVPSRILTCDATCRRFNSDQTGKVELVFGCGTQVIL